MNIILRYYSLGVLAFFGACGGPTNSRERLASVLRDSLGEAADPHVAYQRDSTHLLVELATAAFPTVSDSILTGQARGIGGFTLRHYERANQLDSVTVLYREAAPHPGIWYVRHTRTFPVASIRTVR
jgi:hypothetical protein